MLTISESQAQRTLRHYLRERLRAIGYDNATMNNAEMLYPALRWHQTENAQRCWECASYHTDHMQEIDFNGNPLPGVRYCWCNKCGAEWRRDE
jgi:formate dehydrogenase maturation protein FdhE